MTHRRLLRLAQARCQLLRLRRASGCLGTSRGSSRGSSSTTSPHAGSSLTTSPTPHVRVPRHVVRLITRLVAQLVVNYFDYAARPGASARRAAHHATHRAARRRLLRLRRASGCFGTSRGLTRDSSSTTSHRAGSSSTTSPTPRVRVPRHVVQLVTRLVVDYVASATPLGASARRAARRRLLRLRRASGCFGTSRGLSRDSLSTTSPRAGSSSTISPTPRVWVPRHIARLVTRLVVDYFASAARPGASASCAARRRLLRLRRASGCLDTSRGSSCGSSSTTSTMPRVQVPRHVARLVTRLIAPLVIDYFDYVACPVASARYAVCRVTHRRPLCLAQARRRLLRLRHASGCLATSRSSSRGSSSTTSPPPRVRVPRHVAQLVTRLVVDYFVHRDFVLRPHRLYFSHVVRRDYLSRVNTSSTSTTPWAAMTSSFGRVTSTIHLD
jgi:hypothetical protein